ncbi:MAG TPA: hypothetical protein VGT40_13445 [Methylomirabilota bacterium]|jgi:hypothetical protein|nr:hypothetical protein [Methylomirabilota bacterium]
MSGRGVALLLGLAALAAVVQLAPVAAEEPAKLVAPYLRARDDRSHGHVAGHAVGDPRRPSAAPVPYEGVSVMLLPRSPGFEAELEAIKAHFRDSLRHYMDATSDVSEARATYERALLGAGGGELIRGEVSDARGLIRFADIPAGEWLLLAWRSQDHPGKAAKVRKEDATAFREVPVSVGHSVVTYWLVPLAVQPGETTEVELNDRNVWLTGVREDLRVIEGTPKTSGSKKRR